MRCYFLPSGNVFPFCLKPLDDCLFFFFFDGQGQHSNKEVKNK